MHFDDFFTNPLILLLLRWCKQRSRSSTARVWAPPLDPGSLAPASTTRVRSGTAGTSGSCSRRTTSAGTSSSRRTHRWPTNGISKIWKKILFENSRCQRNFFTKIRKKQKNTLSKNSSNNVCDYYIFIFVITSPFKHDIYSIVTIINSDICKNTNLLLKTTFCLETFIQLQAGKGQWK